MSGKDDLSGFRTREEAMMAGVEAIQADLLPGDDAMLICCAGPPTCLLQADACVEAANRGCPKCTRILIGEELPRA